MPPITIALANEAINELILRTARHSAQADEARQCEEFCGQLAVDSEERTFMFEDNLKKYELLFHHFAELYQQGCLEPWVIAALQLQVAYLCAAEEQNVQDYRDIMAMETHFDLENTRQEDLAHALEVQHIVLLAVRDELGQRLLGVEDTLLKEIDLSF